MTKEILKRDLKVSEIQVRELDDGKRVIEGLIPYNQRSEWMGFYEYITPTAFNKTIADGADVRAFWNHDTTKLLGRVKNGSLRLASDDYGLHIECDLPQTTYAEDVYNLIRGGYNTGMSFGFTTIQDKWEDREEDGKLVPVCQLIEVRLFEVSFCVSFPAYEGTQSGARSLRSILDEIKTIHSDNLSEEEKAELRNTLNELTKEDSQPESEPITSAGKTTEAERELDNQLDELLEEFKSLK